MRNALWGLLAGSALLLLGGCSGNNFLVYKQGHHFFVTSSGKELRTVLCDSGDMKRVLLDAKLAAPLSQELNDSICGQEKVRDRVLAVLEKMTPEERSRLKMAFRMNDYDINDIANC
ncbi:MAG TPA: hypothetical protein VI298_09990 [Geobacteraceae bacterium]